LRVGESLCGEQTQKAGRGGVSAPRLLIEIPLERRGHIVFDADSLENERRLRLWLRHSAALRELPEILARLLDDLDAIDREAA